MDLKQQFENNPKLLKESSKKLAKKFKVDITEVQLARLQLNRELGKRVLNSYVKLAEENGISKEEISGGWMKQKGEPSINFSLKFNKKQEEEKKFKEDFEEFLKEYKPSEKIRCKFINEHKGSGCLLLNKQDSHLDKYDIYGENDIITRFENLESKIVSVLQRAFVNKNLEKIIYVIGSDEFNSEFTQTTTKGTPQQNIDTVENTFENICNHEVAVINSLLEYSRDVNVIYVSGNHDEYQGFYMVSWLKAYYKNNKNIKIDNSPNYRKYVKYGASAIQLNHGDVMKPKDLVAVFPMEFKTEWSNCDHFLSFVGDKHFGKQLDLQGISFFQIPAFSKAVSKWDDKNGYKCKGEVTGFFIDKENGLTDIYKELL